MPRGKKYVNHKGRSRHFTSPEELQQENDESSENESSNEDGDGGGDEQTGATGGQREKTSAAKKKDEDDGESGEDSDEESSEDDRDKRKGVASLIEIENPNRGVKKTIRKVDGLSLEELPKPELTRRDREQLQKQKARLRYEKLHAAGKTHEAKADLARLALIRQQRADAAAKREADKKVADDKKSKA